MLSMMYRHDSADAAGVKRLRDKPRPASIAGGPAGPDVYARTRYEYELRDEARGYRRALHLHSPESFMRAYLVVVHEHCERPIGAKTCEHHEGSPVKDAFAGVGALIDAWTGDPPDCRRLRCLDDRRPRPRRPGPKVMSDRAVGI